jgi:hypothetical protein
MALNAKVTEGQRQVDEADALYERYAKPLESEHRGEYLAVSPTGQTLLAPTLTEATRRAVQAFGPGNFLFKVGDDAVGEWLWVAPAR